VETERQPDDFDPFEDMLYTAAVHAGWLPVSPEQDTAYADVPDTEILIRIPRRG
jgi:hypothetical protein